MPPKRSAATGGGRPRKRGPGRTARGNTLTPGCDPAQPWHGGDSILSRIRLKDLNNNGFIDYPANTMPPLDPNSGVPGVRAAPYIPGGQFLPQNPIHPVWRRENWMISDADYDLLRPVLRLASCYLYEPIMFPWWKGLFYRPAPVLNDPKLAAKFPGTVSHQMFVREHSMTDYAGILEAQVVWQRLDDLKNCVQWRFGGQVSQAYATTYPSWVSPGLLDIPSLTCGSDVHIREEYLEMIRGNVKPRSFPKAEGFSGSAAALRTIFLLATTLVHELNHVIGFAFQDRSDGHGNFQQGFEPFVHDNRINEVGDSWEAAVFGGSIRALGYNSVPWPYSAEEKANWEPGTYTEVGASLSAPYGAGLTRWPGPINVVPTGSGRQRATTAHWGELDFQNYSVPTTFVHSFLTGQFWDKTVASFAHKAFVPPLWLGVSTPLPGQVLSPSELYEPSRHSVAPSPPMMSDQDLRFRGFRIKQDEDADSDDTEEENERRRLQQQNSAQARADFDNMVARGMQTTAQTNAATRRISQATVAAMTRASVSGPGGLPHPGGEGGGGDGAAAPGDGTLFPPYP
ncbi:hypothetical protein BDV97DRAFT_401198 [Delphinella strobiligena]|nr:hypothetical protein BDV97DRAFT_401198 [Delphinella strobiligena]